MTSKQKAIQEAYGDRFKDLEKYINQDGVFVGDTNLITDEEFKEWGFIGKAKTMEFDVSLTLTSGSRPKSLQGIEDNRGWTRIEKDEDLPKQSIECWFIYKNEIAVFNGSYNNDFKCFSYSAFKFDIDEITHYQPIQKPEPPIY